MPYKQEVTGSNPAPPTFFLLSLLLGTGLLFFILYPLLKMILTTHPLLLAEAGRESEVRDSILLTLYSSLLSTLFGVVFGIPLAYLLARFDFRGKAVIEGIVDLPIIIPHTAAGIALLTVLSKETFLGKMFRSIGITFVGDTPGIVAAMMFVSVPFLINSAKEGFRAVDVRLERVARTLGATPWQVFWRISLPLARQSIISGSTMMWARGISEFGAVIILAYHPMIVPVLIYERFEAFGLLYAKPVTVLLVLVCLIFFVTLKFLSSKIEKSKKA